MSTRFLISDTHFGHTKTWSDFKNDDGSPLRNFTSTEEMDEHMIERWNSVVGDKDVVYHLGDVVINRRYLHLLYRLKGRKKLVRGNHDIFKLSDYTPHFEDIYGSCKLEQFVLSHIPIHPESVARWSTGNIHGHLHGKRVLDQWGAKPDPRYICVSVENVDYTPVALEDIEMFR